MQDTYTYNYESWEERFSHGKVNLTELVQNSYWDMVIGKGEFPALIKKLNKDLSDEISLIKKINNDKSDDLFDDSCIYPPPALVFRALDKSPEDTSTIIVGQDPYHGTVIIDDIEVPQATGYCFSLPRGAIISSSLRGIMANGFRNKQLWKRAETGDLRMWSYQGCAMLNTALTVRSRVPNSHAKIWRKFTDEVLYHISENMAPGVVVLWGKHALDKMPYLHIDRHTLVASSHPSGLSVRKKICHRTKDYNGDIFETEYPSFTDLNQFKTINDALIAKDRLPICWQPL